GLQLSRALDRAAGEGIAGACAIAACAAAVLHGRGDRADALPWHHPPHHQELGRRADGGQAQGRAGAAGRRGDDRTAPIAAGARGAHGWAGDRGAEAGPVLTNTPGPPSPYPTLSFFLPGLRRTWANWAS